MDENLEENNEPTQDEVVECEQLKRLKKRIPYDEDRFESQENYISYLETLLEDTEDIALNQLYPFLVERPDLPERYYGWQIRASVELDETYGFGGFKKYSENGLSFEKVTDGMLSASLLKELVPYAGSPENTDGRTVVEVELSEI